MLGGGDADRLGEGLGVVGGASNEFVTPRRSFVHGRFENGGVVHGKWPEQRARSVGDDGGGVLCFLGGNRKGRRKMDRGWVLETGRSECGVFALSKREGGRRIGEEAGEPSRGRGRGVQSVRVVRGRRGDVGSGWARDQRRS